MQNTRPTTQSKKSSNIYKFLFIYIKKAILKQGSIYNTKRRKTKIKLNENENILA